MDAEVNSGACSEYEAKLEDYLGGQLPGAQAREVENHLALCSGCRAELENAGLAQRLFAVAEPTPDPGPGFARITMARLRQEVTASEKGFWQPFVSLAWRFAATVAVAFALTLSYEAVRQHRGPAETPVAQARVSDMRYMFTAEQDRVPSSRDDVLIMVAESNNGNR